MVTVNADDVPWATAMKSPAFIKIAESREIVFLAAIGYALKIWFAADAVPPDGVTDTVRVALDVVVFVTTIDAILVVVEAGTVYAVANEVPGCP